MPRSPALLPAALLAVALGLPGCLPAGSAAQAGSPPPASAPIRVGTVETGRAYDFTLNTHCGIRETGFGEKYWDAVPSLDDGSGNPPDGWGNPFHEGTMRLLSATEAQFDDGHGRTARFRLREGATAVRAMCD